MSLGGHGGGQQDQGNRGHRNGNYPDRHGPVGGGGQQRPASGHHDKRGEPREVKPNWQRGQKCLAKYWEVSTSADHYVIVP